MPISPLLAAALFFTLQTHSPEFFIQLKDGTIISASLQVTDLEIKTEYGTLKIPANKIKVVKFDKDAIIIKTDKTTVTGELLTREFNIKTAHGALVVKNDQIDHIIPCRKGLLNDENVAGFWDFCGLNM